jgi:hypothetical protein
VTRGARLLLALFVLACAPADAPIAIEGHIARVTDDPNAEPYSTPPMTPERFEALMERCVLIPWVEFEDIKWYRSRQFPREWRTYFADGIGLQGVTLHADTAIVMEWSASQADTVTAEHELVHLEAETHEWRDSTRDDGVVLRFRQPESAVHPPAYFDGECTTKPTRR